MLIISFKSIESPVSSATSVKPASSDNVTAKKSSILSRLGPALGGNVVNKKTSLKTGDKGKESWNKDQVSLTKYLINHLYFLPEHFNISIMY